MPPVTLRGLFGQDVINVLECLISDQLSEIPQSYFLATQGFSFFDYYPVISHQDKQKKDMFKKIKQSLTSQSFIQLALNYRDRLTQKDKIIVENYIAGLISHKVFAYLTQPYLHYYGDMHHLSPSDIEKLIERQFVNHIDHIQGYRFLKTDAKIRYVLACLYQFVIMQHCATHISRQDIIKMLDCQYRYYQRVHFKKSILKIVKHKAVDYSDLLNKQHQPWSYQNMVMTASYRDLYEEAIEISKIGIQTLSDDFANQSQTIIRFLQTISYKGE